MDATKPLAIVTLVTRIENGEQIARAIMAEWIVKLLMTGVRSPGFWSGEILPPSRSESKGWLLLQRFRTEDQAKAFQQSANRQALLKELKNISLSENTVAYDEITADAAIGSAVTAIVTTIKPEMEEEYCAWGARVHSAQANFAGYGGVYVQPPPPGKPGQWTTLVRFDSPQNLQTWFDSPERQALLAETDKFVEGLRYHQVTSSFPGVFPLDEEGRETPKWKASLLVLVGLFPILEVLRATFTPWASEAHIRLVVALALSSVVSVALVSYLSMPLLVKQFSWWLAPPQNQANLTTDLKGLAIVLAIFSLEILAAWQVLVK